MNNVNRVTLPLLAVFFVFLFSRIFEVLIFFPFI